MKTSQKLLELAAQSLSLSNQCEFIWSWGLAPMENMGRVSSMSVKMLDVAAELVTLANEDLAREAA